MKITCPMCFAGQKVRDELVDLPVPCRKCGHPFVASDVLSQESSDDLYDGFHDDVAGDLEVETTETDDRFISESAIDLKRVSRAMSYLLLAYYGIVFSFFAMVVVLVAGFVLQDLVALHDVGLILLAVMGLALFSGLFWVIAQFKLRGSHPSGSPLHGLMSKSLKLSVAGILTKIVAGSADSTGLKAIGSILSASAFDSFLLYFEMLTRQLGDFELSERIRRLGEFYRRMLWILFIGVMMVALIRIGPGARSAFIGLGSIGFVVGFTIFAIKLGTMIRHVHQLTRRFSANAM